MILYIILYLLIGLIIWLYICNDSNRRITLTDLFISILLSPFWPCCIIPVSIVFLIDYANDIVIYEKKWK